MGLSLPCPPLLWSALGLLQSKVLFLKEQQLFIHFTPYLRKEFLKACMVFSNTIGQ